MQEIRDLFASIDVANEGTISLEELRVALKSQRENTLTDEQVRVGASEAGRELPPLPCSSSLALALPHSCTLSRPPSL
jgi:hypothetical protein